ncbi:heme-binding protein [Nocardia vinacea]|uniref:GlcG/HbpS family heme-binding protein n=1 Tax=Nocardia vinacea TaxID=96468 RepID=UPI00341AF3B6
MSRTPPCPGVYGSRKRTEGGCARGYFAGPGAVGDRGRPQGGSGTGRDRLARGRGGTLVAFARMDGAPEHTADIAKRKADMAIALGFDTVHMTATTPQGLPLAGGPQQSGAHALVPNGGGVVIRGDGTVLGALGVSGAASSITDHKIGTAAIAESG